jgi:hypothetical protein
LFWRNAIKKIKQYFKTRKMNKEAYDTAMKKLVDRKVSKLDAIKVLNLLSLESIVVPALGDAQERYDSMLKAIEDYIKQK